MERALNFLRVFIENADQGEEGCTDFLEDLMKGLIDLSNSADKSVRLDACTLLATFMHSFNQEVELSESFIAELEEAMLERTRDKVPQVRAKAAVSLALLQVPDEVYSLSNGLVLCPPVAWDWESKQTVALVLMQSGDYSEDAICATLLDMLNNDKNKVRNTCTNHTLFASLAPYLQL